MEVILSSFFSGIMQVIIGHPLDTIKTMNQNNIDNFDLNGGQLSYIKREIKKPLTQKSINEIIRKIEPNQDKAEILLQQIQDSREIIEVEKIQYKERT